MNSNNIKQPFVSGDKEINALLMQLLKLKIVSKILELEKDLGSEVIEELPGDPYRYIDEESVESFYKGTLLGEECMGFVRLNGKAVYTSKELKDGDILEIGSGKFMYIDYAGNNYGWEEKREEAKTSDYNDVE